MIILRNVPFAKQAQFLRDNVCSYPSSSEFDEALSERGSAIGVDAAGGLGAHRDLLIRMYGDLDCIEGKDDKARYTQLIDTVALLYACFAFGTTDREGDSYVVRIDKDTLKSEYKKGSLAKRKRLLEHHGFAVRYLSSPGECASLSRASQLSLAYARHRDLVPALKLFAEAIQALPDSEQAPIYSKLGMFLKADYESAILGRPVPRDTLDPMRRDILDTVGEYGQDWTDLVAALHGKCGLACSGFWHYGASPSWSVSFAATGKRPLAIFTLGSGIVFIEFTLPVNSAERIIRDRRDLSDTMRERIESFHCVKCPKKCQGGNLRKVDGVWLCTGRAEARRIYSTLLSPADFASIHAMIDGIC